MPLISSIQSNRYVTPWCDADANQSTVSSFNLHLFPRLESETDAAAGDTSGKPPARTADIPADIGTDGFKRGNK